VRKMGSIQLEEDIEEIKVSREYDIKITPIAILLMIFCFIALPYIAIHYTGESEYSEYSWILIILGVFGLVFTMIIVILKKDIKIKITNPYLDKPLTYIFYVVIIIFANSLFWFIAEKLRYGLSDVDYFFYFMSTGVIEEIVFRLFLCTFIIAALSYFKKLNKNIIKIIAVLLSAFIFAIAHIYSYQTPTELAIMFLGGLVFGGFYVWKRDITITMLAHIIINFIATWNFLYII
jgi:membrane protease YdiL (CAAX protease family)